MDSTVATEAKEPAAASASLETWAKNEPMRHVPRLDWIVQKLDVDLRRRIGLLTAPFLSLPQDDLRHLAIENELRGLCRSLDRLTDMVRHGRPGQAPHDLVPRVIWGLDHAIASLRTLDGEIFDHRYPVHTFERSRAEPTYAALLLVMAHIDRLLPLIRPLDSRIDEHLLEGLVKLERPLPTEPMVAMGHGEPPAA